MYVLFDWSGTISDDARVCHESARIIGKHYRYAVEPCWEKWMRSTGASISSTVPTNIVIDPVEMMAIHQRNLAAMRAEGTMRAVPIASAVQQLHKLAATGRYHLGVVSLHPKDALISEAMEYGLVDTVFPSESIFGGVRNKGVFLKEFASRITNAESVQPQFVFVGDTVGDVEAARCAGITSIAVCGGYHSMERLAESQRDSRLSAQNALKHPSDVSAPEAKPCWLYQSAAEFIVDLINDEKRFFPVVQ
jgi:phosphoglycolate phosphatase-like HAD superfamily hydrolase